MSSSLYDIGWHNCIKHNASVIHDDSDTDSKWAPTKVNPVLHKFVTRQYPFDGVGESGGQNVAAT